MPLSRPSAISSRVLPTPENTIRSPGTPGRQGPPQLALGHDVHTGAQAGQGPQDRLVRVGLHGVADEGVRVGEGFG